MQLVQNLNLRKSVVAGLSVAFLLVIAAIMFGQGRNATQEQYEYAVLSDFWDPVSIGWFPPNNRIEASWPHEISERLGYKANYQGKHSKVVLINILYSEGWRLITVNKEANRTTHYHFQRRIK